MRHTVYDFGKDKSQWLKVFLPFLIIVHHCACLGVPHLGPMLLAGVTVCTWFFLVSGYGLMASLTQKGTGYLDGFLRKRMLRILVPYVVALCTYVAYVSIVEHTNLVDYFCNRPFDSWLPYSWFIFVIFGGYVLFFLVFRHPLPPPCRQSLKYGAIIFLLLSVAYVVVLKCLDAPRYWYAGSMGMAIGILWKQYERVVKKVLSSNAVASLLFLCSLILWVLFSKYIQFKEFHPLFTSVLLVIVLHRFPMKASGKIIRFLSTISFELYLFQALAMRIVLDCMELHATWGAMGLLILLDVILSALFHYSIIQPLIIKFSK